MSPKTQKDFWVEMSIREISTQAHFAGIAHSNINIKAATSTDLVFSSIHSFLAHCAIVSKMLLADDGEVTPRSIGDVLNVQRTSLIHSRIFRNHLEHYDERLKKWISQYGVHVNVGTYNIGPKTALSIPNMVFVSHYDPNTHMFTFVNEDFDLAALNTESQRIGTLADMWVSKVDSGQIITPFI